jgi:DNA-binding transcriptional LysR family regulator
MAAAPTTFFCTEAIYLMPETLIAVASPELVGGRAKMTPAEVTKLPLLQQTTRPYAWRQWFEACGLKAAHDLNGPRLELFTMLTEAARCGFGAALIPRMLVSSELENGTLVQLTRHEIASDRAYHLIHPPEKSTKPALVAFRQWLVEQASGQGAC